jgi:quercetin dioxygenase-like cupin family protein
VKSIILCDRTSPADRMQLHQYEVYEFITLLSGSVGDKTARHVRSGGHPPMIGTGKLSSKAKEGSLMAVAAHVRFIFPDVMVFNRLALSVVVLASLAWLPGGQIGGELSLLFEPLCANVVTPADGARPIGSSVPISSKALPNVPGKRVTIVRVTYAPGGYTPPHRHAGSVTAYVTAGTIRSQLAGGPVESFKAGGSFFEPPGAIHLVSENASITEPAELIAVFVADEGATLTTYIE